MIGRRYPAAAAALAALLTIAVLCGSGCVSPATRFHDDARERGFAARAAVSGGLPGVVFHKGAPANGEPVHFYLDGDGMPWLSARRMASDPSSRERLVLDLMERDPATSVLVGRPCYYQREQTCDPAWWTALRYSDAVVEDIANAINATLSTLADSEVTLIGYSGGGALAMLVAPRLQRIDAVVTIAANLDVAAWAGHHGYLPPAGSLDPADLPPLAALIRQAHLFGSDDVNVPAGVVRHVADRQRGAVVEIVEGFDHRCCWADRWPDILARVLRRQSPR